MKAQIQMPVDNHEAEMARADLYKMAKYSMKLFQMIQEGQELEGWVQAKITKASDYISSIYHYMEYQMKFGGGMPVQNIEDITSEAEMVPAEETVSEEDDEVEMKEGMSYEQRLEALLESKVKKMTEKKKPSAGMSKKEKSAVVKKARAGKDIGKPGKGFKEVEKAAKKGGAKDPKAVAAAAMWKKQAKESIEVTENDFQIDTKELKPAHDKGYADAGKGISKSPYNPGSPADKAYQEGQAAYKRHFG